MTTKMPAHNGRFGVMAAVAPQKRQCKFGSLYPAGSSVEAATTPSRWDVSGKADVAGAQRAGRLPVDKARLTCPDIIQGINGGKQVNFRRQFRDIKNH